MNNTRRGFLKSAAAGASLLAFPAIVGCSRQIPRVKWLGWKYYDDPTVKGEFEEIHGCKVEASYFDGNSEAYARLASGGAEDFDLVMGDGYWPRLYFKNNLVQSIDIDRIENYGGIYPDFNAENFPLTQAENDLSKTIAIPNCWGGYGLTYNTKHIQITGDHISLNQLFKSTLGNKNFSTSARYEENIALAGVLAAHDLGSIDREGFSPYDLTAAELNLAEELLMQQKKSLYKRWHEEATLEKWLRDESVVLSPEWSGMYRRIEFDRLAGQTSVHLKHDLKPIEGGLGWVDTWMITRKERSKRLMDLSHEWINFRLKKANMLKVAQDGWSPCIDVRSELSQTTDGERHIETLFLNRTAEIKGLYQFKNPSDNRAWTDVWNRVLTS